MSNPPPRTRDLSLVLAQANNTPDFVTTAIDLGHFIECEKCGKVLGVGTDRSIAVDEAARTKNGKIINGAWLCIEDAGEK